MKSIMTAQDGHLRNLNGEVTANINGDIKQLHVGEFIPAGTNISISQNSSVDILFDDGSIFTSDSRNNEPLSTNSPSEEVVDADLIDALSEIEEIQALIAAGEDPTDGPDTAAGGQPSNQGSSGQTSISRSADETIASSGFSTSSQNSTQTDSVNIEDLNLLDSPTITTNDVNTINEDSTASGNVLTNDSDADNELTIKSFSVDGALYTPGTIVNLESGSLSINEDGSYVFIPNENWNGSVPIITYTTNTLSTATLTLEVTPVDDASILANDSNTFAEDTTATGNVLDNDTDIDNDLSVVSFEVNGNTYAAGTAVLLEGGSLVINADGSYTFTPNDNWNGSVPSVTYTTNTGSSATLTLEVTPVDDTSTLENDSNTVAEDSIATGNVLDNDSDIDNDLSVISFEVNGNTYAAGTTVLLEGGSLVINTDGSYTFTPNDNWNGSVPSVTYTTNTGSSATLTLEVTPVDDASALENDSNTVAEDTTATGNVLDNDSDIDNDLSVVSFEINGNPYTTGTVVVLEGGSLVINSDGSYTFTPNDNWNGQIPVITYTTNTGSTATLTLEVTPVDDASILENDSNTVAEDSTATGNVLDNDTDIDNDLSVVSFQVNGNTYTAGTSIALVGGSVVINSDGSYAFTPDNNWNGSVPVITYTTNTGSSATLTLKVIPVNDAPVAANDNFNVDEGDSVSGNMITHDDGDGVVDTDGGDGAALSITHINGEALSFNADGWSNPITVSNGTLRVKADGSFEFTHDGSDPTQTNPSFNYTLSDGTDSDTGTVSFDVGAVNDAPVAANDNFNVDEGETVTGNMITHDDGDGVVDTDGGDGAALSITHINDELLSFNLDGWSNPIAVSNGTLRVKADGSFEFTHDGSDPTQTNPSFKYTLSDGTDSDTGTVSFDVNPIDDTAPNAPTVLIVDDGTPGDELLTQTEIGNDGVQLQVTIDGTDFEAGGHVTLTINGGAAIELSFSDFTNDGSGNLTFGNYTYANGVI
ncbi:retention module-containing protein, partial [Shewanella sairae]|uniref:retention module-containing protein n=1 Tax=Shewanella sairae TaxID=190310 RepID=UPI001C7EFBC0